MAPLTNLASLHGALGVLLANVPDLGQIGVSYFSQGYLAYFLPTRISHVRFSKTQNGTCNGLRATLYVSSNGFFQGFD